MPLNSKTARNRSVRLIASKGQGWQPAVPSDCMERLKALVCSRIRSFTYHNFTMTLYLYSQFVQFISGMADVYDI